MKSDEKLREKGGEKKEEGGEGSLAGELYVGDTRDYVTGLTWKMGN